MFLSGRRHRYKTNTGLRDLRHSRGRTIGHLLNGEGTFNFLRVLARATSETPYSLANRAIGVDQT